MSGDALVVRADALRLPLPDNSVDLIVTSPPYFALRSYRDGDEHYSGQLGSEPTPQAFLEALWAVMAECWRVLKPTGSVFVNLGDKRAGSGGHNTSNLSSNWSNATLQGGKKTLRRLDADEKEGDAYRASRRNAPDRYNQAAFGRAKSKMLLPHRFAIGCEDGLADPEGKGWIMRQDQVIWKKNGLPESCTDRTRDAHEYWFHLTKSDRYFSAIDEIRERRPGRITEWNGSSGSCQRCGKAKGAGLGEAASPLRVTPSSGSTVELFSATESATNSTSDPSLTDSSSTTCAGTGDASTPGILSPLPSEPTSSEVHPPSPPSTSPRPSVGMVTSTTPRTPTAPLTAAACAECVCEPETESGTGVLGTLPSSVWEANSEPLIVSDEVKAFYNLPDHFAAFVGGTELVRKIVLGWSPSGVCCACGEGRRPVVAKTKVHIGTRTAEAQEYAGRASGEGRSGFCRDQTWMGNQEATITGYSCRCTAQQCDDCRGTGYRTDPVLGVHGSDLHPCPTCNGVGKSPPTRPAVVLDPFSGTGTTVGVARALGRIGVGVDLSHDYSRLADYLIHRSSRFAKVAQRTHRENQQDLFGVPA